MKALIEEYGHTAITLILASAMVVMMVFGMIIPQMQAYAEKMIPEETVETGRDFTALTDTFFRKSPKITIPSPITMSAGTVLDFNECIEAGAIIAVNADGVNISKNITVEPADQNTKKYFTRTTNTFGGTNISAGEYNFILTVIDYTDEEYYGKTFKRTLTITVE